MITYFLDTVSIFLLSSACLSKCRALLNIYILVFYESQKMGTPATEDLNLSPSNFIQHLELFFFNCKSIYSDKKATEETIQCISASGHPEESCTITSGVGYPNCAPKTCLNRSSSTCVPQRSGTSRSISMESETSPPTKQSPQPMLPIGTSPQPCSLPGHFQSLTENHNREHAEQFIC